MLSFSIVMRLYMKTSGKRFEDNWKKSVPSDIFYYRLRDGSSSWGGNDKVRFQQTNICDAIMFDGHVLFTLELKSTKGKSLPYSNIKSHQIEDLMWCNQFQHVISGFVIEFSDLDECYYLDIVDFNFFKKNNDRKSIPIEFCRRNGFKINVKKKKINRSFDISKFIYDVETEMIM